MDEDGDAPGRPIGPLSAGVAALCDEARAEVRDPATRAALAAVRRKLGEPLRVALAGSVSSGKSTLVVRLSNERLRDLTLIDTPGLDSIDPERERATEQLLGLEASSRAAIADADALLLLMPLARRFDGEILQRFHHLYAGTGLSAANAAGVISKVDRLAPPGEDPWPVARELAAQACEDLALTVADVAPIAGLIASTAMSGELTEADARALRALGELGPDAFEDALLTATDLLSAEVDVPDSHRRRLLGLLDLYGIRVAASAAHRGGAGSVVAALLEASGFEGLDRRLRETFARRADALKAHVAACDLDRLSYAAGDPADGRALRRLRDPLDQLASEPEFHELRLLEVVRSATEGDIRVPEALAADLERIARHADARSRLGLATSVPAASVRDAAGSAAARWADWANDPRRSAVERAAGREVRTAYEWIWHGAQEPAL